MGQDWSRLVHKEDIWLSLSDGVLIHQEPDILQCEVKWVLGSITTNKASGGDWNSS